MTPSDSHKFSASDHGKHHAKLVKTNPVQQNDDGTAVRDSFGVAADESVDIVDSAATETVRSDEALQWSLSSIQ